MSEVREVCVVTGGGSGMGLAAAMCMPKEKVLVLSGRTVKKLEGAIAALKEAGHEAYAFSCDVSDRSSVRALAAYAASLGEVKQVLHCAGISPAMGDADKIVKINALGTVYVNQEFSRLMKKGSVIVDVASNSAYALPGFLINKKAYALAEQDEARFQKAMLRIPHMIKKEYNRSGLAYALSKNFVVWYAQKCAFSYGERGIRVASLSPGLIATDMGNLEAESGGGMLKFGAERRMGKPEELGFAIAALADERNGYLAGVDILCDGGCTNGKEFRGRTAR